MIQKAEDGMNAGSAKKGKQSSKNKKVTTPVCDVLGYKRAYSAVKQHVRSSDAAKRCIARISRKKKVTQKLSDSVYFKTHCDSDTQLLKYSVFIKTHQDEKKK